MLNNGIALRRCDVPHDVSRVYALVEYFNPAGDAIFQHTLQTCDNQTDASGDIVLLEHYSQAG